MKRIKNTLFLLIFGSVLAFGQSDMAFYCDVMNNAFEASHRLKAANEFDVLFNKALSQPESFNNRFAELKWISIKYPEDESFRIITWQLKDEKDNHIYKGVIQVNTGQLFKLNDESKTMVDSECRNVAEGDSSSMEANLHTSLHEQLVHESWVLHRRNFVAMHLRRHLGSSRASHVDSGEGYPARLHISTVA